LLIFFSLATYASSLSISFMVLLPLGNGSALERKLGYGVSLHILANSRQIAFS